MPSITAAGIRAMVVAPLILQCNHLVYSSWSASSSIWGWNIPCATHLHRKALLSRVLHCSLPFQLPLPAAESLWDRPVIPATWWTCPCVIPSPWGRLRRRIWQSDVMLPPRLRDKKTVVLSWVLSLGKTHPWEETSCQPRKLPYELWTCLASPCNCII